MQGKSVQFNLLGFKGFIFDNGWEFDIFVVSKKKLVLCKSVKSFRYYRKLIDNAVRYLQLWPVYFEVFQRDCDLSESTRAVKFLTYFSAMKRLGEAQREWDEGPFYFHQISKKEFEEFQPTSRDRIAEAFDNGNGTRVVL